MTVKLSDRQREAVFERECHLLVAAGAGTGKTSTVVTRLCYLLGVPVAGETAGESDRLSLGQIAAITFTNAAAADLKDKLRRALRTAGRRDLAVEVETARIGTIHSFCGELLNEFALHADLPPNRKVLDESAAGAMLAGCVRETLVAALSSAPSTALTELVATHPLDRLEDALVRLTSDASRLDRYADAELRTHELVLLDLARQATERFRAQLAAERSIDFDGMIRETRDLLLHHPEVRAALQRRLRLLIIDEFQDVDPVQREIAWLIGDPERGTAVTPRLMLVGDPKQSIYRFRRADVTLWNGVAASFAQLPGARVVTLDQSFRSVPAILGFVDTVAGAALDLPVGADRAPYEVSYVPLHPTRQEPLPYAGVELHLLPSREDGKPLNTGEARAREAAAIAQRILELQREDPTLELREIAILLTGWGALGTYERALRAAGIATYALRAEGFWERAEIQDLLLALRAIRDRTDDIALVGFLRGPWAGVRDETLYALAQARRTTFADALASATGPDAPVVAAAVALLDRFSSLRDRIPLHELMRRLLEESGYLAWCVARGTEGAQAVANLRKVLRIAANEPDLSLGDFLRLVHERQSGDIREGDARLFTERDNVVTITSVHSAKGLDWRVVIWADLMHLFDARSESFLRGRERFRYRQDEGDAKDPDWQSLVEAEKLEQLAEQRRLWYVALTRAKDRLICTGIRCGAKAGSNSPEEWLWHLFPQLAAGTQPFGSAEGIAFAAEVRSVELPPLEEEVPPPATVAPLASPLAAIPAPRGRGRLSATQLLMHARDPERWRQRYLLQLKDLPRTQQHSAAAAAPPEALSPRVAGSVVHDVLEHWAEHYSLDDLLDAAIERVGEDETLVVGPEHAAGRAALRALIARVVTDPAWASRATHPSARRELPFTRILEDGLTIEGAFDLVLLEDGAVRLVDVKTSTGADPAALADAYRVQGEVYAEAASALTGRRVAGFTLYLTDRGLEIEVPHDATRTLAERVRALTD